MNLKPLIRSPLKDTFLNTQEMHDSILADASASLHAANFRHVGHDAAPIFGGDILNAQIGFAQTYLGYLLGFSDTAGGKAPTLGEVEAAADEIAAFSLQPGSGFTTDHAGALLNKAIKTVGEKIDLALSKPELFKNGAAMEARVPRR